MNPPNPDGAAAGGGFDGFDPKPDEGEGFEKEKEGAGLVPEVVVVEAGGLKEKPPVVFVVDDPNENPPGLFVPEDCCPNPPNPDMIDFVLIKVGKCVEQSGAHRLDATTTPQRVQPQISHLLDADKREQVLPKDILRLSS